MSLVRPLGCGASSLLKDVDFCLSNHLCRKEGYHMMGCRGSPVGEMPYSMMMLDKDAKDMRNTEMAFGPQSGLNGNSQMW